MDEFGDSNVWFSPDRINEETTDDDTDFSFNSGQNDVVVKRTYRQTTQDDDGVRQYNEKEIYVEPFYQTRESLPQQRQMQQPPQQRQMQQPPQQRQMQQQWTEQSPQRGQPPYDPNQKDYWKKGMPAKVVPRDPSKKRCKNCWPFIIYLIVSAIILIGFLFSARGTGETITYVLLQVVWIIIIGFVIYWLFFCFGF